MEIFKIEQERDGSRLAAERIGLSLSIPPSTTDTSLTKPYYDYHHHSERLSVAQQKLASLLLMAVHEATLKLDSSVQVLNNISADQAGATKSVASSSKRLEWMTLFLIGFAIISAFESIVVIEAPGFILLGAVLLLALLITLVFILLSKGLLKQ